LSREAFAEPSELSISGEMIDGMLTACNVSPVWTVDWDPSPAQHDGMLVGWQSSYQALLFAPGSWIFIDGGLLQPSGSCAT